MNAAVLGVIAVGAVLCVIFLLKFSKGSKSGKTALSEREYRPFRLQSKKDVNHNTMLFRFELPSPDMTVGLPVGMHLLLRAEDANGAPFSRAYTPVSSDDEKGYFDLIVKIYPEGKMGQYLKKLPVGSTIEAKGPMGEIRYHGQGRFSIMRKNQKTHTKYEQKLTVRRLGLIAGGSGITPMLQLMRAITKDPKDTTEVSLIYGNVEEKDILLREELDRMAEQHKNVKVFYTLDRPPANWKYGSGFVTAEMMKEHLPPPADDTLILCCGPPMMIKSLERNLAALDYPEDHWFKY